MSDHDQEEIKRLRRALERIIEMLDRCHPDTAKLIADRTLTREEPCFITGHERGLEFFEGKKCQRPARPFTHVSCGRPAVALIEMEGGLETFICAQCKYDLEKKSKIKIIQQM